MRYPPLVRFESRFRVSVPASIHAFAVQPPSLKAWTPSSPEQLAEPETRPTCLGFFPLMSNPCGDEMGLYFPPGESRPLVVQRGHEEDVLMLIEEHPRRFASSPRDYLEEPDWFRCAPRQRQVRWKAWVIGASGHSADELLKPLYVAENRHLLDRERTCTHRRAVVPELSKGCVLEPLFDGLRDTWDRDKRCAAFRSILSGPSDVNDWSRWFHLGRRLAQLKDDTRAVSAFVNAMAQTFWENYPLILPHLGACVNRLKWDPAREQVRRWIPYVADAVAWRPPS